MDQDRGHYFGYAPLWGQWVVFAVFILPAFAMVAPALPGVILYQFIQEQRGKKHTTFGSAMAALAATLLWCSAVLMLGANNDRTS